MTMYCDFLVLFCRLFVWSAMDVPWAGQLHADTSRSRLCAALPGHDMSPACVLFVLLKDALRFTRPCLRLTGASSQFYSFISDRPLYIKVIANLQHNATILWCFHLPFLMFPTTLICSSPVLIISKPIYIYSRISLLGSVKYYLITGDLTKPINRKAITYILSRSVPSHVICAAQGKKTCTRTSTTYLHKLCRETHSLTGRNTVLLSCPTTPDGPLL